jgi:hypothetical protein
MEATGMVLPVDIGSRSRSCRTFAVIAARVSRHANAVEVPPSDVPRPMCSQMFERLI